MRVSILTVPVEPNYSDLQPKAVAGRDVFASIRSEGRLPVMPKIAVVSLIHWMRKRGWPDAACDFYDVDMELPTDERLARYFRETRPDVIGLSAVVSTCYYQVRRISRIARQVLPDAWIVMGGSLSASANLVLRRTDVDVCVVGDGEIPWCDFLEHAKASRRDPRDPALEKIGGLAYLDAAGELRLTGYGRGIPSDQMPMPDYEILRSGLKDRPEDLAHYFRPGLGVPEFQTDPRSREAGRRPRVVNLWTSKGCVARCTFCQRSTKGYRTPAIESFEAHIVELKERFDVGFVHVLDENFGSDIDHAYACAEILHRHGMLWMASGVRVSSLEFEDIEFFHRHGCSSLKFGVESGSQKIMNVMEKKFTVERVFKTLKHCADLGMLSPLVVMVGMPGETNETAAATGRFLGRLSHMQGIEPRDQEFAVFYALPLPGTPLYVYGQQIGVIGRSPEEEESYLESVGASGASKVNYLNLNGAPIGDVIFWDWLVKLEAMRTFLELDRANPIDRGTFIYRTLSRDVAAGTRAVPFTRKLRLAEVVDRLRKGVATGIKSKLFYGLDHILEHHVVYNPAVYALPRWILHPLVRGALLAVHGVQRVVAALAGREFNLFRPIPKVAPLALEPRPGEVQVSMSLRTIVRERSQLHPPRTPTEANQQVLAIGL